MLARSVDEGVLYFKTDIFLDSLSLAHSLIQPKTLSLKALWKLFHQLMEKLSDFKHRIQEKS